MSSVPPPLQYQPRIDPQAPPWLRQNLTLLFQKLTNHAQAFALQQQQIAAIKAGGSTTTTIEEGAGGGSGGGGTSVVGIPVNNQTGSTVYTTMAGDNGALIIFSDPSAIAVSLPSQTTPWSCFIANQGTLTDGTVTLTPASGTINGGTTLAIPPTYLALIAFDSTNWWAATLPIVPVNTPTVSHEWLASYNAATGQFTQTQPTFSDISGTAAPSQLPTPTSTTLGGVEAAGPVAHEWISEIDTSGAPHLSQPAFTDISGTAVATQVPALSALSGAITASQLPANVPVVSFGAGAPTGSSTEGYIYFNTSVSPYNGYVYHSGAWQQFS